MNKTELVAAMAEQAGLSKKDAEKALKAFTDVVADELKKEGKSSNVRAGCAKAYGCRVCQSSPQYWRRL